MAVPMYHLCHKKEPLSQRMWANGRSTSNRESPASAKNGNFGVPVCRFCTFCTSDLTDVKGTTLMQSRVLHEIAGFWFGPSLAT